MSLVLYTAAEVADLLKMNHQVVQRKLAAGEIPAYRIGREWRVEHAQLMSWLEQHSNQRTLTKDEQLFKSFVGADGRFTSIPAKRSKRDAILRWLALKLEPNRTYPEKELNAILREYHDDVAFLRRGMIEARLLVRTPGGIYKRVAQTKAPRKSDARREAEQFLAEG